MWKGTRYNRAPAGEKISYAHNNPVEAGLVFRAQDYVYSSASDYADEKGLLDDIVVFRYYG